MANRFLAIDNHHTLLAVIKIAEHTGVGLLLAKLRQLGIEVFLDTEHIG
ncbi:hypothetical protein EVA_19972 [gut metagenome]|uniref:Uncharacterized protein n=1 Tax=gut metagenome TaxID=749906 RepID=J9FAI2_9ZZZZ